MDIGSISAAMSSLKTAGEITSALLKLKTNAEVQSKAIELNEKLIRAQQEIFTTYDEYAKLKQQVQELEKKLIEIDEWNELKKMYKLINPWDRGPALVYAVKKSYEKSETAHWICTKCYDDHRRSILQPHNRNGFIILVCSTCNAEIDTGFRGIGKPDYAPD